MSVRRPSVKKRPKTSEAPALLTLADIELYKQLPVLTMVQIARVLQKPIATVYEISRSRAKRPLPVFKSGRDLCSTWAKIQEWVHDGFAERAA